MVLRGQGGVAHLGQQLGDRGIGAQVDPQRLCVDEEADQRFEFATGAVGDRRADHDFVLSRQARQQH